MAATLVGVAARENDLRLERLAAIKLRVRENYAAGREPYAGLKSSEIADYNGALMFGDNDEAFPDDFEWARNVD